MKFKNYKSAIHNFAHSFQSVDYMKSARLAVNVLIDMHKKGVQPLATFDFLKKTIEPMEAISKESTQLMNDYISWLPDHFKNHNCDLVGLETLRLTIWTDFEKALTPKNIEAKQISVQTKTIWKAAGRPEQSIDIVQDEVIADKFLRTRIPEF